MRIVRVVSSEQAEKLEVDGTRESKFRVMPYDRPKDFNGKKLNTVEFEKHFDRIEQAAEYLIINPGSGIRMKPSGSVYYNNIAVVLNEK